MKKTILISILVCAALVSVAQTNFVKNPDFEQYHFCPRVWDEIHAAKYWNAVDTTFTNYDCRPDYCNRCVGSNLFTGVPENGSFYQQPRSGDGMVQVAMYDDEKSGSSGPPYFNRDYLRGSLYKSLTNGKEYCLTFYVNLEETSQYASNNIGAYFDDGSSDSVEYCGKPMTFVSPQVYESKIINDTANWIKIEGSFIANGTESVITIGNFFSKDATSTIFIFNPSVDNDWAWYLIADVSVIPLDLAADAGKDSWVEMGKQVKIGRVGDTTATGLDCKWYKKGVLIDSGAIITVNANAIENVVDTYVVVQTICGLVKTDTVTVKTAGVGIAEYGFGNSFSVYPNPSNGAVSISYSIAPQGAINAKVYDLLGRVMHQEQLAFSNKEASINLNIPNGSYIIELKDKAGNVQRERIVKH